MTFIEPSANARDANGATTTGDSVRQTRLIPGTKDGGADIVPERTHPFEGRLVRCLLIAITIELAALSSSLAETVKNFEEKIITPKIGKIEKARLLAPDLPVALYIPPTLASKNPSFAQWDFQYSAQARPPSHNKKILTLNLSDPLSHEISLAVKSLFTDVDVWTTPPPESRYALAITIGFDAEFSLYEASRQYVLHDDFRYKEKYGKSLVFNLKLRLFDRYGICIETIQVSNTTQAPPDTWRTTEGRIKFFGKTVLRQSIVDLVDRIERSSAVQSIRERDRIRQAQPPSLETTLQFDDSGGYYPDSRLDAGEEVEIVLTTSNRGPGVAFDVYLRFSVDIESVDLQHEWKMGELGSGEERELVVPVRAAVGLQNGPLRFIVETVEKRGYGAPKVQLDIQGAKLRPPELAIADIVLNDRIGRAQGDGDGLPANGETIEATLRIENRGSGAAVGVRLNLLDPTVKVMGPLGDLARIPAGESREAVVLLHVPPDHAGDELTLHFTALDQRGADVGYAEAVKSWPLVSKRPILTADYRLYDGTSPGSVGNRDGVANNSERVEVGIVVVNRGDLVARDVRMVLSADDPSLTLSVEPLAVGDLAPGARAREHRVPLLLPRQLGTVTKLDRLAFRLRFEQADFPPSEVVKGVHFEVRRPVLKVEASAPEVIVRGRDAPVMIQLWNEGNLDAEKVAVEIETTVVGIELYDLEHRLPASRQSFELDTLVAGDRPMNLRLMMLARQEAELASGSIRIHVRQQDFASQETEVTLLVQDELVIVPVEPQIQLSVRQPPAAASPANVPSIAFLDGLKTGQQVKSESLVLRFEVQTVAGTGLRAVNLEHRTSEGSRDFALGAALGRESHAGRVAESYEIRVELAYGFNHFTVAATTATNDTGKRMLSLNRIHDTGRLWVVVIGVGEYENQAIPDLAYVRQDGQSIYDYYRDALQVPAGQLLRLFDEQATQREILKLLGDTLRERATNPGDTVILYFAGHGMIERDSGSSDADGLEKYLVPWDADPKYLFSTAINMKKLREIFDRLVAERIIVLADTCFSGAAGGRTLELESSFRSSLTDDFLQSLVQGRHSVQGRGRLILTASGANEVAEERAALGHGVFTYYLLEGLEGGADDNCDGLVTFDEIYRYTFREVSLETGGRQNPARKQSGTQVGEIVVGRSRQPCVPSE